MLGDMVNGRTVRILLECNLVIDCRCGEEILNLVDAFLPNLREILPIMTRKMHHHTPVCSHLLLVKVHLR